jgi:hypothetical protein
MRAYLVALVALTTLASTGCSGLNLFRRGTESCNDPIGCTDPSCTKPTCTEPVPCAKPVGCAQPIGCAAGVSPAGPAGVSPAMPAVAPYAAAPYAPAPYAAPYQPSYTGGYGHRHGRGYGDGFVPQQGPPAAQVGYPYYTTRGPRDFLINNPPSIGR